jgi:hypothetical protein
LIPRASTVVLGTAVHEMASSMAAQRERVARLAGGAV